jgi:O-antigen ligase
VTTRLTTHPAIILLVASIASAALGWVVTAEPLIVLAVVTSVIALFALTMAATRLLVITFGLLWVSLVPLVLIVFSAFIAQLNGSNPSDWARDAAPYALLPMLPIIGIDCGRTISPQNMVRVLVAGGLLAAVGFSFEWLDRRGVNALGLGKFTLATAAMIAALLCYAIARAAWGSRRITWSLVACGLVMSVVITGTRTGLIFLAAFAGIAGSRKKGRIPVHRLLAVLAPVVVVTAVASTVVASVVSTDPNFLSNRVNAAVLLIQGDRSDASYLDRVNQYGFAQKAMSAHPLLGTGPGFLFPNSNPAQPSAFTLDTPLVTPAKFGIVGTAVFLLFLAQILYSVHIVRKMIHHTVVDTAIRAFAWVFLLDVPFGGFIEDKGFSIALMLLLGLLSSTARETVPDTKFKRGSLSNTKALTRGRQTAILAAR